MLLARSSLLRFQLIKFLSPFAHMAEELSQLSCTKVLIIIVALLIALVYDHLHIKGPLFNADHLKDVKPSLLETPYNCQMSPYEWNYQKCEIYVPIDQRCKIHLWVYSPRSNSTKANSGKKFPTVIMSHGYSFQKDFEPIDKYGRLLASNGFVAVALDYSQYGGSFCEMESSTTTTTTTARQNLRPYEQVADIVFITRHIISNKLKYNDFRIDKDKIALFGIGHAGGFMLSAADIIGTFGGANITCIVSQTPFLSGKHYFWNNFYRRGFFSTLRHMTIAFMDLISSSASPLLPLHDIYIKVIGFDNETSYFIADDKEISHFNSTHPPYKCVASNCLPHSADSGRYLGGWQNLAPAKGLLHLPFYNPIEIVKDISAPILFIAASKDDFQFPASYIRQAYSEAFQGRNIELAASHYDLFSGRIFDYVSSNIVDYLKEHLEGEVR